MPSFVLRTLRRPNRPRLNFTNKFSMESNSTSIITKSRKLEKLSMRNSMIRLTSRTSRNKILDILLIFSTSPRSMLYLLKSSSISLECKTNSTEVQWERVLKDTLDNTINPKWEDNHLRWDNHQWLNKCQELVCQEVSNKWECHLNQWCNNPCPCQAWWEFLPHNSNSNCHSNSNMLRKVILSYLL